MLCGDGALLGTGISACQRMRTKRQKSRGRMNKVFMQLDEYQIIVFGYLIRPQRNHLMSLKIHNKDV